MIVTLTAKGQVTLPRELRERIGLDAGSTLDFQLLPDNSISARAVKANARNIRGLLRSTRSPSPSRTGLRKRQPSGCGITTTPSSSATSHSPGRSQTPWM